jgi:hypothetical protein
MNPEAILALISDLYQQIATLTEVNKQLREALAVDSGRATGPAQP